MLMLQRVKLVGREYSVTTSDYAPVCVFSEGNQREKTKNVKKTVGGEDPLCH